MIFYFSGTGNSQMAAKQIGGVLGDEIVSINHALKSGTAGVFHSEPPLVFVAPTYGWRLPRVVKAWLQQAEFTGNLDAYFVLTCGDGCGDAAGEIRKLCAEKSLRFRGLAPVVMPENYIALFQTPTADEAEKVLANARPQIAAIAAEIQSGKPFSEHKPSLAGKLESGVANPLFYQFCVSDKGFWVTERCTSCGKCAERCPLNNIKLVTGKPQWNGNCTHCMACIGGCPVGAIEYKKKSAGRARYDRMEGSL